MRPLLLLPFALLACRPPPADPVDDDADGYVAAEDCNDADPAVNPAATETCNGVDDDCSGAVDDGAGDATTWYADGDADGYGDPGRTALACDPPDGFVADATDCDDQDADFHPGADESTCTDPSDYNCDGSTGYADADADGFPACQDCDDASAAANPGEVEVCNGADDDCDGQSDEAGAIGEQTHYADDDGDGFGDPRDATRACAAPTGTVSNDDDCNDAAAAAHPGAAEICDGFDNDCNGDVDGGASDAKTWYADADGDGIGNAASQLVACSAPDGFAGEKGDCNDGDATAFPGATEACDEADDDCDGAVDEGFDEDGDGFTTCGGDCDDAAKGTNPSAKEACGGADEDCDGETDERGATGEETWYVDYDADGFGVDKITAVACVAPSGFTDTKTDCDDTDADRNPGADPACDGRDLDCDGKIDSDADGDEYPDDSCGGTDCDDSDPKIKPEAGGQCALGKTCLDILEGGRASSDGVYPIDPDGSGTGAGPFDAWCDMTTDDGGWTLVYSSVAKAPDKSLLFTGFVELRDQDVNFTKPDYKKTYRLALKRWNAVSTSKEWMYTAREKFAGPSGAPPDFWTKITDVSLDGSQNYRARYGTAVTVDAEPSCIHRDAWFSHVQGHRTTYCSSNLGTWMTPSHCGGGGPPWLDACCWQMVLGSAGSGGIVTTNWAVGQFLDGNLFYSDTDSTQRCGTDKNSFNSSQYEYVGVWVR